MARTKEDAIKDKKMLSRLKIGDKVQFKSGKQNYNKIGIVVAFRKYEGKYGAHLEQEYCDYTSVIVELDNKKQINVSPRNLIIVSKNIKNKNSKKDSYLLKSEVQLVIQNYIRGIQMIDGGTDNGIPQLYEIMRQIDEMKTIEINE